ncbi:Transglycosylase-like domain-containing protein [Gaiella occulta]|uniref:Transglycosylase-like domain-containing protein n=1 Tax=Gaiella occulta TaxID=1002870 RepID=A0A7M2YUI4_9ACTN|nr:transglycosylase family protein [Gaiella occulta]RDI73279.1 Transglycosylase-like domain-containing protein [Gaiella occulta]
MLTILAITTLFAILAIVPRALAQAAHTYRPTPMPKQWQPPGAWLRQAMCIHRHESVDWHRAGRDWQGRPSPYFGGMQFLVSTWRRAGGSGLPSDASPREQLYRAYRIWDMGAGRMGDGLGSWREWGTAGACGLR